MHLSVLVVLIVYTDICVEGSDVRGKFGEKCVPGSCLSPLVCDSEIKQCKCDEGHYDAKAHKCVMHVNDPCIDSSRCPANTTCEEPYAIQYPQSVVAHFEKIGRSMSYSRYDLRFCRCQKGLEFNPITKQCAPALQLNHSCSEKLTKEGHICEKRARLTCAANGTCQCYSNRTFYDPQMDTCVLPVGQLCAPMMQCVQNAWCSYVKDDIMRRYSHEYHYSDSYRSGQIQQNMKTRGSKCECILGYKQNSAGKCLPDYHVECSTSMPCYHESLDCVNGLCHCKRGLNGRFMTFPNKSTDGCYLTEGASCSKDSYSPPCAPHSKCTKGICRCDDGLIPNFEGRCHLSHGSACTSPSTINGTMNIPEPYCNQANGLACVNGKCACVDSALKWNEKTKECVAGEGGRCGHLDLVFGEDRNLGPTYPIHPFLENHRMGYEVNSLAFFTIRCEQGFHCVPQSDYMYGQLRCIKQVEASKKH